MMPSQDALTGSVNATSKLTGNISEIQSQDALTGSVNATSKLTGSISGVTISPKLQYKFAIPSKEYQVIEADEGYDGLNVVDVAPIPDEYVVPTGELPISKNGKYDVKEYAGADVNIEIKLQGKTAYPSKYFQTITTDSDYDGMSYVDLLPVTSDIDEHIMPENIKEGIEILGVIGEYKGEAIKYAPRFISFYMYQGTELDDELAMLDVSNITDMRRMFFSCKSLKRLYLPNFVSSKVTNIEYMFYLCSALSTLDITGWDTSNVTTIASTFNGIGSITAIPELNGGKIVVLTNSFKDARSLNTFGGLKDLGKAYLTTSATNYANYKWDLSSCTNLTHDSLMNIINNLYDIKTKGCNSQQLVLGSTNLAKLTSDERAIATNKGWTVS